MTDLIAIPWHVNVLAILDCGHRAGSDDIPKDLVKSPFAYWYATCPHSGARQRITCMIVRKP